MQRLPTFRPVSLESAFGKHQSLLETVYVKLLALQGLPAIYVLAPGVPPKNSPDLACRPMANLQLFQGQGIPLHHITRR